jgi:hypothetical protein
MTPSSASRAKAEVAIRRIKGLLMMEKGRNEATFEALLQAHKQYQEHK